MESETKIPIWLDCDPGHDDAFAILISAHHPSLSLMGISTVHGNSSLAHTTYNATSLVTALGVPQIPVHAGASHGLVRPAVHADAIHGESGLDGTSLLPTPTVSPAPQPAVDAMASALLSTLPGTAYLIATGALTNIAQLFQKYPDVAAHIKGLSIMGGAIGNNFTSAVLGTVDSKERIGNWSIWAEFNILVDPEAAQQLFQNEILKVKTTLIPLDVTHLVLATKEVQDLLLYGKKEKRGKEPEKPSILRAMLVELLYFFADTYEKVFNITDGPPLHDPLAVVAIFDGIPGLEIPFYDYIETESGRGNSERYEVNVVTEGSHEDAQAGLTETGRTVVRLLSNGEEGIKIPRNLNVPRFWMILEQCLERADAVNKAKGASGKEK